MSNITNAAEARLRPLIFGNQLWTSKPTTLYIAFFTTAPDDSGAGAEYTGNGYARLAVACTSNNWTVTGATVTNAVALKFAASATADWTGLTHMGIYDRATGGTLLFYAAFKETRTITKFSTANIPAGNFALTLDGAWGTWMANKALKYVFNAATWTAVPTFYVGYGTNADADQLYGEPVTDAGATATGYARGSYPNTTAKWPASTASPDTTSNAASISNFPDATADQGQFSYQALLSAPIVTSGITWSSSTTSVSSSVTYGQSGTTITVSKTAHGLNTGDAVTLTFSAGTGGTGADGYYIVTKIDADSFTVTSAVSATITGSPSCSWVPAYIVVTNVSAHGLSTTHAQTGAAQHVDMWFTSTSTSYPTSKRYYVASVPSSTTVRLNLASDGVQIAGTGNAVWSIADMVAFTALTSAITVNNTDTTSVPTGAITANFD